MPLETIVALLPSAGSGGVAVVVLAILYQVVRHGLRITVEPLQPPKPRKRKRRAPDPD